ncbi:MAG: hypothetical protein QGE97_07770 [SAR324 cluster bacterium]|nr:hypothetical protein [SAR324 cluster bacterium]
MGEPNWLEGRDSFQYTLILLRVLPHRVPNDLTLPNMVPVLLGIHHQGKRHATEVALIGIPADLFIVAVARIVSPGCLWGRSGGARSKEKAG